MSKCGHIFDYANEMKRISPSRVDCRCAKCGKMFSAYCGVDFVSFGKLVQLANKGVMFA